MVTHYGGVWRADTTWSRDREGRPVPATSLALDYALVLRLVELLGGEVATAASLLPALETGRRLGRAALEPAANGPAEPEPGQEQENLDVADEGGCR